MRLAALVITLVILQGCAAAQPPIVHEGVWGERSATGEFCAWSYTPTPGPSGHQPFGGSVTMFAGNGDWLSDYALANAGVQLDCVIAGPVDFFYVWQTAEPNMPSVYGIFDGVYGIWDSTIVSPVSVRALVRDNTGPQCANGLPCEMENSDPSRFTFQLNGRDVPITTIVTLAGFPGHMYRGAFDPFGEFYPLPAGVDPTTLSWRLNWAGRFDWQQDTLPEIHR